MKIYRNHKCSKHHKSARTFLRCAIPTAAWIHGTGNYALIAWCNMPTISLYQDPADAAQPLAAINGGACGQRCNGRHEIVHIDFEGP